MKSMNENDADGPSSTSLDMGVIHGAPNFMWEFLSPKFSLLMRQSCGHVISKLGEAPFFRALPAWSSAGCEFGGRKWREREIFDPL